MSEVLKSRPSMIRYHDLTVKLFGLGEGETSDDFFGYKDPFFDSSSTGIIYPITINRIIYSSDATPTTMSGIIPDFKFSKRNVFSGDNSSHQETDFSNLETPYVGCGIMVEIVEDGRYGEDNTLYPNAQKNNVIFKGYITSMSRQITQSGVVYNFEARDIKTRLLDQTIKKVYNNNYKVGAIPVVDEEKIAGDNPYVSGRQTIEEIIKDIMAYSRKTACHDNNKYDFTGFKYSDFDYNGDNYLKNFIPPTITFDNITILEAIYKLINTAGPYRIVVSYGVDSDKIFFSRIDNKFKNCGPEIKLKYGNIDDSNSVTDEMIKSFNDVNVISDSTVRKIYDVCNIMKSYTGQIEWYSGHFYIIKGFYNNAVKEDAMYISNGGSPTTTKDDDSMICNILSCRNWDGYNYFFGVKSIPMGEKINYGEGSEDSESSTQFVVVGAPLYPAWDPLTGYEAYSRGYVGIIESESDKAAIDDKSNDNIVTLNYGITENDRKFIKHRNFLDTVGKDKFYNAAGLTYVAYVPYGICPACKGTGAVEDNASMYSGLFGRTRSISGRQIATYSLKPFEYGFRDATYESKGGMERYCGNLYTVPGKHPLPWKNTCPICRGTGMEPWFKMGTILNNLVEISPSQAKIGELTSERIGASNSNSLQIDKTYAQITEDMSYKYPVVIHVETNTSYPGYSYADETDPESFVKHSLVGVKQVVSAKPIDGISINTNATVFKTLDDGSSSGINADEGYVQTIYYTQISEAKGYSLDPDRSLVVFNNSQFISCKKPMKVPVEEFISDVKDGKEYVQKYPYYSTKENQFKYSSQGEMNGIGNKVGGYWRPARAWITCYFKRDRYEDFMGTNPSKLNRTIKTSSGSDKDYYNVYTRIEDNRYCAEIIKTNEEGNIEEFKVRPIAKGIFCDDFKWQLHPWDFKKYNVPGAASEDNLDFDVPTDYSNLWDKNKGIYSANKKNGYYFPCGKLMKYEPLRDIEARALANAGQSMADVMKSDITGKIIAWAHNDDRMKLFEKACAELERRNNIQISGTISVRGELPVFVSSFGVGGFGYVTLYDGLKACVVKIDITFGNDFIINLEVGTEELRVGQKKEKDMEYERLISDAISGLNIKNNPLLAQSVSGSDDYSDNVSYFGAISVGGGTENG